MPKNIWIDNLLLFKIYKVYLTQHLCLCTKQTQDELNMQVGDIIFIKDTQKKASYRRLGEIRGFNGNKVIVGIMGHIGTHSKSTINQLHKKSLNHVKNV
jgi:hypothetical protein